MQQWNTGRQFCAHRLCAVKTLCGAAGVPCPTGRVGLQVSFFVLFHISCWYACIALPYLQAFSVSDPSAVFLL